MINALVKKTSDVLTRLSWNKRRIRLDMVEGVLFCFYSFRQNTELIIDLTLPLTFTFHYFHSALVFKCPITRPRIISLFLLYFERLQGIVPIYYYGRKKKLLAQQTKKYCAKNGVTVGFNGYCVDFPIMKGIGESKRINSLPKFRFSASSVVWVDLDALHIYFFYSQVLKHENNRR